MIVPYTQEKIWDLLKEKAKANPGPQGFCQFYMDGQFIDQGSNLVVAGGREYVAQRLFNEVPAGSTLNPSDVREHIVGLFGVGAGGATCNANVVQLQGPTICDTGLYLPISLGVTEYLDDPLGFDETDPLLDPYDIYKSVNAVKPIRYEANGDVELIPVDYGACADQYTKVKCTCIVPPGEPGASFPAGGTVPISEAGLFFAELLAESPEQWSSSVPAQMFAHITFAPKWKEKESEFRIIWYIII